MTTFTVNQKVLKYRNHHDTQPTEQVVVKVTSRTVKLDDGSTFDKDGIEWGAGQRWERKSIRAVTE